MTLLTFMKTCFVFLFSTFVVAERSLKKWYMLRISGFSPGRRCLGV
ncbi:hypothetical protein A1F99_109160 [Pyrenophora tritici-repentis]|nr:hypothetical protein A1F99_109160 [Pyrenophora tritici-repentis]